jgi:hypothetical protein
MSTFIKHAPRPKGKYEYPENSREISGFGGGYEDACRTMVITAMNWLDENPNADISYKEYQNIYGLTTGESDDCKKMQEVMMKAVDDNCSGAMMQACLGHIMYAHKNGWEKYITDLNSTKGEDE